MNTGICKYLDHTYSFSSQNSPSLVFLGDFIDTISKGKSCICLLNNIRKLVMFRSAPRISIRDLLMMQNFHKLGINLALHRSSQPDFIKSSADRKHTYLRMQKTSPNVTRMLYYADCISYVQIDGFDIEWTYHLYHNTLTLFLKRASFSLHHIRRVCLMFYGLKPIFDKVLTT